MIGEQPDQYRTGHVGQQRLMLQCGDDLGASVRVSARHAPHPARYGVRVEAGLPPQYRQRNHEHRQGNTDRGEPREVPQRASLLAEYSRRATHGDAS